jgi:hypothetical protein
MNRTLPTVMVALVFSAASCASEPNTAVSTSAEPAAASSDTPNAAGSVLSADEQLAASALLQPGDLGQGWVVGDHANDFPNSAELARTIPECADFAELVFDGGTQFGQGSGQALTKTSVTFGTYVIVFSDVAAAKKMIDAVASPAFDDCWARYNEQVALTSPYQVTESVYTPQTPPTLTVDADTLSVKFLDGYNVVGGSKIGDTCVCAFAQVGRGIVELHSERVMLNPDERSAMLQKAIDKLRSTLA